MPGTNWCYNPQMMLWDAPPNRAAGGTPNVIHFSTRSCQMANGWTVYGSRVWGMRSMTNRPSFSTGGQSSLSVRSNQWINGVATVMPNNCGRRVAGHTFQFSMWVRGITPGFNQQSSTGKKAVISIGWFSDPALDVPFTFTDDWQYVERTVTFPSNFRGNPANGNLHVHWIRGYGNHARGALYGTSIGLPLGCTAHCPNGEDNAAIAEARMVQIA